MLTFYFFALYMYCVSSFVFIKEQALVVCAYTLKCFSRYVFHTEDKTVGQLLHIVDLGKCGDCL